MIAGLATRAGGVMPPAFPLARGLAVIVLVGASICGEAFAFNAYGEVALKKDGHTTGRFATDTLSGARGTIAVADFTPAAKDATDRLSVAWMLPKESKCPLVESETERQQSLAKAALIIQELHPDLRRPIDVKVYVVPMLVRLRHKARFDLASERVALEIGMSVPCRSKTVSADMMSVLIHELTHIRLWSQRTPNRYSNEAIAYSVHIAAWGRIRGEWLDFRAFPHKENSAPSGEAWSRLFRSERPLSSRAGRIAQHALASLPRAAGAQAAAPETVAAYVRCLLEERPDFRAGNPAAVFAETGGAHCSAPSRSWWAKLAGR